MAVQSQVPVDNKSGIILVYLVDDHVAVRRGVAAIVREEHDMQIIGEAIDGCQAVEQVRDLNPDIVLMDIKLPDISGIDATRRIKETNPEVRVIIYSAYSDEGLFIKAIEAGASGYVVKATRSVDLLATIRTVYTGDAFITPGMATTLIGSYLEQESRKTMPASVELVARQIQEVVGAAIVVSSGSLDEMVLNIRKQVALIALERVASDDE